MIGLTYLYWLCLLNVGMKMHSKNEENFCAHMRSFILHITEQNHQSCLHRPRAAKVPRLDPIKDADALKQLEALVTGYINDCQRYIHGFSTIQLEVLFSCTLWPPFARVCVLVPYPIFTKSLNGTACKRVDKERNWTTMYTTLFDLGIFERNEGASPSHPSHTMTSTETN
jgi:hypothetical protein